MTIRFGPNASKIYGKTATVLVVDDLYDATDTLVPVYCDKEFVGTWRMNESNMRYLQSARPGDSFDHVVHVSTDPNGAKWRVVASKIARRQAMLDMRSYEDDLARDQFLRTHHVPPYHVVIQEYGGFEYRMRWEILEVAKEDLEDLFDSDYFQP